MWRCANDIVFGFCNREEPDWDKQPDKVEIKDSNGNVAGAKLAGGSCKLNSKTCGNYSTKASEEYPDVSGHYTQKLIKIVTDAIVNDIEKGKKKGKKTKVKKQEVKQGELF